MQERREKLRNWWAIMAAGATILLAAAACSSGGSSGSPSTAGTPGSGVAGGQQASDNPAAAPGQPPGVKLCEIGESGEQSESGESAGQEAAETKIPCITIDVSDQAVTLGAPLVNQGPLELIINNLGSAEHTIVISGPIQGNTGPIKPGQTARMRGRIMAGDYEIYSVKDNQKEAGLEATLKVQ